MPAPLPEPLAAYFSATNAHDVAAMISHFASEATVEDEAEEYRGLDAIREWMEETIRKYDFAVEVTDAREEDGRTVVTGLVAGNFPGSPVKLRHEFTLDHQKIAHLVIR